MSEDPPMEGDQHAEEHTAGGSKVAAYHTTTVKERRPGLRCAVVDTAHVMAITAMTEYEGKSFEQLRWEDYCAGVKQGPPKAQNLFAPLAAPPPDCHPAFDLPEVESTWSATNEIKAAIARLSASLAKGKGQHGLPSSLEASMPPAPANSSAPHTCSWGMFGLPDPAGGSMPMQTHASRAPGTAQSSVPAGLSKQMKKNKKKKDKKKLKKQAAAGLLASQEAEEPDGNPDGTPEVDDEGPEEPLAPEVFEMPEVLEVDELWKLMYA